MRSRIARLVLATTSAVVISFVVPLCLLVRTLAEDRAMAAADQAARNAAILVSTLDGTRLGELLDAGNGRGVARTSVLRHDGSLLGAAVTGLAEDPAVRRALQGEASTMVDSSGGEVVLPVVRAAGTDVVVARVSPAQLHRGVTRAWLSIIGLGVGLLVLALLAADRISRRISRPLVALAATADELRAGRLESRARAGGTPETRELARALNDLAERITELLAAERAAVADLSHRLRTPVTALRLDAEAVRDPAVAERLQSHIATLQRDIDAIVHDARRPVLSNMTASSDLSAVVAERLAYWRPLAEDQDRALEVRVPDERLPVGLATTDLRDLVDVLVDNVFAHTGEGVPFAVEVRRDGPRAVLVVADRGGGIAERRPRPGTTGLGLDIVRRAVAAAGGRTRLGSNDGHGTRVEITLPLLDG